MSEFRVKLVFEGGTPEEREEVTDAFTLLLIEHGYNISQMKVGEDG